MYTGRWSDSSRPSNFRFLPWLVFLVSVGLMITWVLLAGEARHPFTISIVATTGLAVFIWSVRILGPIWTTTSFVVIVVFTYLLELAGTTTGIPFGEYTYNTTLGWQLAEVPIIVPIAWYAMAIPTLVLARALTTKPALVVMIAAIGLTAWDFLLDPWMVSEGHWQWTNPEPGLPGLTGIPVTNYIGWIVSTFVLFLILDRLPRRKFVPLSLPLTVYSWQWLGGALANFVFLDQPTVALYVFVGMGLLAVPAIFTQYVRHR